MEIPVGRWSGWRALKAGGFRLIFSATSFPGNTVRLEWQLEGRFVERVEPI
jgi:hypothetical protein